MVSMLSFNQQKKNKNYIDIVIFIESYYCIPLQ